MHQNHKLTSGRKTDGIINIQLAREVLSRGKGRIHGTDSSVSMIAAAEKAAAAEELGEDKCSFEGISPSFPFRFFWKYLCGSTP